VKKHLNRLDTVGRILEDGGTERLASDKPFSRKDFVAGAGATSLSLFLAACGGNGNGDVEVEADEGVATVTEAVEGPIGVAGGPSGFDGAERYQYDEDSAPGRAIAAARRLREQGRAPDELVIGLYDGSVGNYTQPFPEGAQSVFALWEELTGIPVRTVGIPPDQAYARATRMAATNDGSQHLVVLDLHSTGDLVEAGLLRDLSDFVEKYGPDWNDEYWGYIGGEQTTQMFNYYKGRPYAVASDGDYQIYVIRRDLWDDETEQRNFRSRFGYDLEPPRSSSATWPSSSTGRTRGCSAPPTCARPHGAGSTSSTGTSPRPTRSRSTGTTTCVR
jgi:hypothetical protein